MVTMGRALEVADDAWEKAGFDSRALSPTLQVVHLIGRLEFEVALGGVLGWLTNMGEYGPDTVKVLETVEAHQCAAIVREMLAFFPEGAPAIDCRDRMQQILAVEEVAESPWRELGSRLLTWPEDIYALLQKFIAEHEADFS